MVTETVAATGARTPLPPSATRLLLAATGAPTRISTETLTRLASAMEDWHALIVHARAHGVILPIATALLPLPRTAIPDQARHTLQTEALSRTRRAMATTAELACLIEELTRADIPVRALKGPTLAAELYGGPANRDPGDLDLLVPAEQVVAADRILRAQGYHRQGPVDLDRATTFRTVLLKGAKDLDYAHAGKRARVELHWRWHRNPHALTFDATALWHGTRAIRIGPAVAPVPDLPELWLYLASHGGRHSWYRLKWITDIRRALTDPRFLAALPDARALSRSRGGQRALDVALTLAARLDDLVDHPEPTHRSRSKGRTKADRITDQFARKLVPGGRLTLSSMTLGAERDAEWRLTPTWRRRLAGRMHAYLTPTEHDVMTWTLAPNRRWLYVPLRPALWIWRHLKRRA